MVEGYLAPGDYYIDSYSDNTDPSNQIGSGLRILNKVIKVDNNGVASFDLAIPADNVNFNLYVNGGTLPKARVNGILGNNYNVFFSCETTNGVGGCYLPPGSYKITNYDYFINSANVNRPIEGYDIQFVVNENGSTNVSILIPSDNFSGTLKRGINKVPNASITFVNTVTDKAFSSNTDENGNFGLYLPDGTYRIDSYSYFEGNVYKYASLSGLDKQITVGAGNPNTITIDVPTETVKGSINNMPHGFISIYKIVNGERKMAWAEVIDGTFEYLLSEGTYFVYDIWEIGTPNTPENGRTITLAGLRTSFEVDSNGVGEVAVETKPDNVTGTLTQDGQAVPYAWINMSNESNPDEIYNIMVVDGNFSLYVPDGTYKIYKYEGQMHQNSVSLDMTVTISQADPASRVIKIEN
jgi:hypothetical protein